MTKTKKKIISLLKTRPSNIYLEKIERAVYITFIEALKHISYKTEKQTEIEKSQEQYEVYKNLNPQYFEEVVSSKDAKLRIYPSDIKFSSDFNFSKIN